MATPRNRVRQVKLNRAAITSLLKDTITDDIVEIAKDILPQISNIYKDENGAPYKWEVKFDKQARAKRMYAVIYCESMAVQHKEAEEGLIAKKLKSMQTKSRIQVGNNGTRIQLT